MTRNRFVSLRHFALGIVAAIAFSGALPPSARAQGQEWQFALTPYVWFATISGQVKTGPARGADFDLDFGQIFDHLSILPVMLSGEARNGRIGFVTDLMLLGLKSDLDTRGVLFNDGTVKVTTFEFAFTAFYRLLDEQKIKLDGGVGFRLWDMTTKIRLRPGLLAGRSDKINETFVDPVFTLRGTIALPDGWSATMLGDVGGFGVSSHLTWQALGTINYQAANWVEIRAGYRYIAIDRKKIDVSLSGPIIGATFRF